MYGGKELLASPFASLGQALMRKGCDGTDATARSSSAAITPAASSRCTVRPPRPPARHRHEATQASHGGMPVPYSSTQLSLRPLDGVEDIAVLVHHVEVNLVLVNGDERKSRRAAAKDCAVRRLDIA